jgi:hypothetical protein
MLDEHRDETPDLKVTRCRLARPERSAKAALRHRRAAGDRLLRRSAGTNRIAADMTTAHAPPSPDLVQPAALTWPSVLRAIGT